MTISTTPKAEWKARLLWILVLLAVGTMFVERDLQAQDLPPQRQIRTYIPPEQIVNFLPTTPLNQFMDGVNPIFMQALGKRVIDPEGRNAPIGISVIGMYFFDAFEVVLEIQGLSYRETDQYFIVEEAPVGGLDFVDAASDVGPVAMPEAATLHTREVQIEAILFEANTTAVRDQGIDWSILFSTDAAVRAEQPGSPRPKFFLRTDQLFESLQEWVLSPSIVDMAIVNRLFRFFETTGVGRTLANPTITVQSGVEGRIQIGSDIPVTQRDFAGNTLTSFAQTGIIIQVTPTLISEPLSDTTGSPVIDFIHLDVTVERSNGRPFGGSIAIDRSQAETQALLLDGEMTVVGGLYSTDEVRSRRGIPILKDLPGWFFGLRYLFGYEDKTTTKRELVIVLQAHLRDTIPQRAERALPRDVQNDYRRQMLETIRRFNEQEEADFPIRPQTEGNNR